MRRPLRTLPLAALLLAAALAGCAADDEPEESSGVGTNASDCPPGTTNATSPCPGPTGDASQLANETTETPSG